MKLSKKQKEILCYNLTEIEKLAKEEKFPELTVEIAKSYWTKELSMRYYTATPLNTRINIFVSFIKSFSNEEFKGYMYDLLNSMFFTYSESDIQNLCVPTKKSSNLTIPYLDENEKVKFYKKYKK